MINLGGVSIAVFTRKYLTYLAAFVAMGYYLSLQSPSGKDVLIGMATVIFLDFIVIETRMIIIHNPFGWDLIGNLNEKKAYVQSLITTMRFLLYAVLLFVIVALEFPHGFFFGFFIAYFIDIFILVLASSSQTI